MVLGSLDPQKAPRDSLHDLQGSYRGLRDAVDGQGDRLLDTPWSEFVSFLVPLMLIVMIWMFVSAWTRWQSDRRESRRLAKEEARRAARRLKRGTVAKRSAATVSRSLPTRPPPEIPEDVRMALSQHDFGDKSICTRCGCSRPAVSAFGFPCKKERPSPTPRG